MERKDIPSVIDINCGGTIFKVSVGTLKNIPFFRSYLDRWGVSTDSIFIDQDPILFRHVLNLVRIPGYNIPEKYSDNIILMAEFYGISINKIEEPPIPKLSTYTIEFMPHFNRELTLKGQKIIDIFILTNFEISSIFLNFMDVHHNLLFNLHEIFLFNKENLPILEQKRIYYPTFKYQLKHEYIKYFQNNVYRISVNINTCDKRNMDTQGDLMVFCEC